MGVVSDPRVTPRPANGLGLLLAVPGALTLVPAVGAVTCMPAASSNVVISKVLSWIKVTANVLDFEKPPFDFFDRGD